MPRNETTHCAKWSNRQQKGGPPPAWVPLEALYYLAHTETGLPIRTLARYAGCHASTVSRKIRDVENRRDDQLVDAALRHLGELHFPQATAADTASELSLDSQQKESAMSLQTVLSPAGPARAATTGGSPSAAPDSVGVSAEMLRYEGMRVLRRLADPGAVLAVAADMDKAVVVREGVTGHAARTAVVDNTVAQAMALKAWIACDAPGRVSRYRITTTGRAALTALMAEAENRARQGMSEGQARFDGPANVAQSETNAATPAARRRLRYCTNETPLQALARRRDKTGLPFLSDELVRAGERLREDFELAQMGAATSQNWDSCLTGGVEGGKPTDGILHGPAAARARIAFALSELGPGLGDMALRCCCYLEGLEMAERRMGWSARSGKIVLRIALQRLRRHYDETYGAASPMIG